KAIAETFSAQEWRCFAEPVTFKAARSFASHPAGLRLPPARLFAAQPSPPFFFIIIRFIGSSTPGVLNTGSHAFRVSPTRQDGDPARAERRLEAHGKQHQGDTAGGRDAGEGRIRDRA